MRPTPSFSPWDQTAAAVCRVQACRVVVVREAVMEWAAVYAAAVEVEVPPTQAHPHPHLRFDRRQPRQEVEAA